MLKEPVTLKRWSNRKAKVVTEEGTQVGTIQAEIVRDYNEITGMNLMVLKLWMPEGFELRGHSRKVFNLEYKLSLTTAEVYETSVEELNKLIRAFLVSIYQVTDVILDPKKIVNKREVVTEWIIPAAKVTTNVGEQVTDLHCAVEKIYYEKKEFTLFERKVLGYRLFKHLVDVTPVKPIRQNRDKDYLPAFSKEGNDAISSFSFHVEDKMNGPAANPFDIAGLTRRVFDRLEDWNRPKKHAPEKPWWNRTLFRWRKSETRFYIASRIYPFHDDHLSGWTDMLSLSVTNDDEDGFVFDLGILGFHANINCILLQKLARKLFIHNRPVWGNRPWEEYYPVLKKWQKEHKFEHFWDAHWHYKIGLNRANGLHYRAEFNHTGGRWSSGGINPLRNRFWNLI